MYGSGPGKVDLHGTNALIGNTPGSTFLCLQHHSTSEEKHGGLLKRVAVETAGPFPAVSGTYDF